MDFALRAPCLPFLVMSSSTIVTILRTRPFGIRNILATLSTVGYGVLIVARACRIDVTLLVRTLGRQHVGSPDPRAHEALHELALEQQERDEEGP